MKRNWSGWIRTDRQSLLFGGLYCFLAAIMLLYLDFSKPKIKSKDDLTFISGQFMDYNWVEFNKGSSLTFRLQNYSNNFRIIANFYSILKKTDFENIASGDTLTIAIQKGFDKYLNYDNSECRVYSITDNSKSYMDYKDAIKQHNSNLFKIVSAGFTFFGFFALYFRKKYRPKMDVIQ